jgi:CRISPR-associated protein Csx10
MSKLTILMHSDWHIGSGTGRPGNVDRLIQRDEDNLPYIPAKTLTGILRDSCELVADGLDEGSSGIWHCYLEYLFGSQPAIAKGVVEEQPTPAALAVRSARFPETLRNALRGKPELISALTFIKPGVGIDPLTGTAQTDFLRFEEMARSNSYLEADYKLNLQGLNQEQKNALAALFIAGASLVERVGAKRRRGAGRCQIKLEELNVEKYLANLEGTPPPLSNKPANPESQSVSPENGVDWFTTELHLETISPLIIHQRTIGNLVSTLDYIPGAFLLPIISKYLGEGVNLGQAISNNQIIVSNATLEVDQQPGRSMPFAFFQEKQNKNSICNRLGESTTQPTSEVSPSAITIKPQLKGMRSGYIANEAYGIVPKGVTTHNTVDDKFQRPNENVGGVYSYESIPPKIKFQAKIHIQRTAVSVAPNKKSKQNKKPLNSAQETQTFQIGRSKKDDYGLVKIRSVNIPASSNPLKVIKPGELVLWLLSDVLIRNSRLRPSTDPKDLARLLAEKLGVKLDFKENSLAVLARSRRTESWQTRWGLPRPSLIGLSAGSCFLFTVTGEIDQNVLAQLERTGIGERTAEGYGQLCFNDPLLMQQDPLSPEEHTLELREVKPLTSETGIATLINQKKKDNRSIYNYARLIEQEAWRTAILRQSASWVADSTSRQKLLGIQIDINDPSQKSKPSMSQLGVLRSIVMTSLADDPAKNSAVINWINELPEKIKQQKWPESSLDSITKLLTTPDHVWKLLEDVKFDQLTLTAEGNTTLKKALWRETVQNLVMDAIRAHKRDLEKEEK